jgi:O-antigen/teichoic acid export membrane protein
MNMSEDEHNKEDVTNSPVPTVDRFTRLPATSRPRLRRVVFVGIVQGLSDEHSAEDSWAFDEEATLILPITGTERVTDPALKTHTAIIAEAESHLTPVFKLIKTSGIYALASVAPPLVSLILAPFLAHHLSPSDYGILTILNILISLGAGITQLGLASAFFRAYGYDYVLDDDRRDVLATVTALLCLISIPTTIGMAILSPFLADLIFGRPSLSGPIALTGGIILLQNLTVPGFALLRVESRALFYSLLAFSNVLITLIATVVLMGVLHWGIAGSLVATGCGYFSAMIFMIPMTLLRTGMKIRADIARNLLTFGLPLVLNFVSYWVLQASDRYLLSLFGSFAQTASYAVAYSLGSIMSVVVLGPFTLAWPTAMFAIAKREDAAQVFRLMFRWFSLFLLFATFGLSLVGRLLLTWLFPLTYQSAAPVIPIIAESIAFFGVYYFFMVGANVTRKTWLAAVFTTAAALVNVAINLVLIPLYGAMGAAISTLLAFVALALLAYVVNQRIYPVQFDIGIFIIALSIGMALYLGSSFLAQTRETFLACSIYLCAFGLYGGCLAVLGKFPARSHRYNN